MNNEQLRLQQIYSKKEVEELIELHKIGKLSDIAYDAIEVVLKQKGVKGLARPAVLSEELHQPQSEWGSVGKSALLILAVNTLLQSRYILRSLSLESVISSLTTGLIVITAITSFGLIIIRVVPAFKTIRAPKAAKTLLRLSP